jgi:hypothetical protein
LARERVVVLENEAATAALGAELALFLKTSDVVALSGELGAGKTTLARAAIRALARDAGGFEVPSPTFTLVQAYDFTRVPVTHFDLYRISNSDEVLELGFDDAVQDGAVLVEWPDRMAEFLPPDRLDIAIAYAADGGRRAVLTGRGVWATRLDRMSAIEDFIAASQWRGAERLHLQGDASTRRYERLRRDDGAVAILMDMPARADAAPVRDGKSYSALVHLADDIRPVVAITNALRDLGLAAPEILHCDLAAGLAVIEDFGDAMFGTLAPDGAEIETAYGVACDVLVHVATSDCRRAVPLPDGAQHIIQDFDRDALQFEVGLLLDWFWPERRSEPVTAEQRGAFEAVWDRLFAAVEPATPVWVLRDYHSPNLIWRPQCEGFGRLGLIDYQDAVMGHAAYDLASLLQDARIDVPRAREESFFNRYLEARSRADSDFNGDEFAAAYATLGAQRCTKILGIFARLDRRDGKPGYLRHMPRVSEYLERNLAHPALADLKAWYDAHLPADLRDRADTGRT